jgi:hypothetical protein
VECNGAFFIKHLPSRVVHGGGPPFFYWSRCSRVDIQYRLSTARPCIVGWCRKTLIVKITFVSNSPRSCQKISTEGEMNVAQCAVACTEGQCADHDPGNSGGGRLVKFKSGVTGVGPQFGYFFSAGHLRGYSNIRGIINSRL